MGWLPNPLNRWVRQKYFYLRSCFGVLGRIRPVQLSCSAASFSGVGGSFEIICGCSAIQYLGVMGGAVRYIHRLKLRIKFDGIEK